MAVINSIQRAPVGLCASPNVNVEDIDDHHGTTIANSVVSYVRK